MSRLAVALQTDLRLLIVPGNSEAGLPVNRREIVLQWHRAFEASDLDAVMVLYHDEAVLHQPGGPNIPFGGMFQGKSEIRKLYAAAWAAVRHEPVPEQELSIHVSDETVTMNWVKGIYMPDGRLARFPCVQIFTFAEHLIIDHRVEYDTLDFARQFELLP
jgi:ketosteroid isomerase-like protein